MNEIKHQLDKLMGDSSKRAEKVMMNVGQNKKQKPQTKKRQLAPVYFAFIGLVAIIALLVTIGPFRSEPELATPPIETGKDSSTTEIESIRAMYNSLFKPEGYIAYFVGEGNEYADLREKTIWVNEDYVIVRVDNGGGITDRVFRISNEKVALISTALVDDMNHEYTLKELEAMQEMEVLFEGLIKDGTAPNGNTITTNVTFETPFKTFTDAIVVKNLTDDGSTNETVYVAGYGIVGTVFTSKDGFKVTSLLNAMSTEEHELDEEEGLLAIYNTTTKQTELFKLSGLNYIDSSIHTEEEIRAMNIQYEMIADTTSGGELGLLTYQCDLYGCGYSVVLRNNNEAQTQFSSYGQIPTISYMPTRPYVVLKLSTREFSIEESNIERNSIFLFNTEDEEIIVPEGANREHFESPLWPILDVSILDTGIVTYKVADIPNVEFDTIKSWQMSGKPVKEFKLDLTK